MRDSLALRECMKRAGVSQRELGRILGQSQQSVYNMLSAKRGIRIDSFVRVMEVLGFEVLVRDKHTGDELEISFDEREKAEAAAAHRKPRESTL